MTLKETKPDKCFNCKEKTDELIKVWQKGKIRWWCDMCYKGYLIETKKEVEE